MEKGVTSPTWGSPPQCNHGWYSVTSAYAKFMYNMSVLCEAKILAVTRSFEAIHWPALKQTVVYYVSFHTQHTNLSQEKRKIFIVVPVSRC